MKTLKVTVGPGGLARVEMARPEVFYAFDEHMIAERTTASGDMMSIWQWEISAEVRAASHHNSATSHLGLEFLEVGDDYIVARVPVDAYHLKIVAWAKWSACPRSRWPC